ncbi:MAG: hypothetical protein ACP5N1_05250 [Candidatus Woesearchaeota archaeon]
MNKNLLYGTIFAAGLGIGLVTQYLTNNKLDKIKEDITAKITADSVASAQRSDIFYTKDKDFGNRLEGYLGENYIAYNKNEYTKNITIEQSNGDIYNQFVDFAGGDTPVNTKVFLKTKTDDLYISIDGLNADTISIATGKKLTEKEKIALKKSNVVFDFFEKYVDFKLKSR